MALDPVLLSRLQFFWVIAFHILLPAFTVGLSCYIAVLEWRLLRTGDPVYFRISSFWLKIFAISFGLGVVSGIVMPFQFGTNWSRFSDITANIVGPLMGYEVLTAFFLESSFLGILLFGRALVPPWAHFVAALAVAAGTLFSSFWILAANSWMQTPAGFAVIDGRFVPIDWWAAIFNPSFPYRLAHTVTAFLVTTGFVVLGVAAMYLRQGRALAESRHMLSMTLWLLTVLVPLQIILGDMHGLNTLHYQPEKVAAMEGDWETRAGMPFTVVGWPDEKSETNLGAIDIPYAGSLILTHSLHGVVHGLKDWPRDERPPVPIVFWAFRIMVAIGFAMLGLVIVGNWLRWRGRLYESGWFLRLCAMATPFGFVAVIAGWVVTETGRQPWAVYRQLRTADAVTPSLSGGDVLASLLLYVVVYLVAFPLSLYYMRVLVRGGPDAEVPPAPRPIEGLQRPLPAQTAAAMPEPPP
ncbi:MAG: cytochrome ubiquinol oxidase subunit I [Thiohalocapsa sp.]